MSKAVSQKSFRDKPVTDETGRKFKSISEMADFYGIKRRTLTWRLKRGYSMKNALRKDAFRKIPVTDFKGREFESQRAMCKA